MAKPNSFMARQAAKTQEYIQATCDIYSQFVSDCACIALYRVYGFSAVRNKRFHDELQNVCTDYHDALGSRTKAEERSGNTEYLQEKLDAELKLALGEHFEHDFAARYPMIRKVKYR